MDRLYPIFLKLTGVPCLVVGGGAVATRKVQSLLAAGAEVTVISPACTEELLAWAEAARITLKRRRAEPDDVHGFRLVFCATDDPAANQALAQAATAAGALVNVADSPGLSSFFVPAVVNRERLQIAISTQGAGPALAKRIRRQLEEYFGPEYDLVLAVEAFLRPLIIEAIPEADRQAVFGRLAECLPELCRTAATPEELRQELAQLLKIPLSSDFAQLVSRFFR
ncbi:MAG: bifunctional precorrin-2 dehydrogenase/sirohydrochlorin ferrochelatase [Firmicutes bacterium]|nr:bifunctional precorrin-2 dehydrogenase/sirohydrochlorin ferrochelatase [Bacillota bacterium]